MFYGINSRSVKQENVFNDCASCLAKHSIVMNISQKYFHFFWIPFFPLYKTGEAKCENCKKSFTKNEMSPELLRTFDDVKLKAWPPVWMFTGIIVVVVWVAIDAFRINDINDKNSRLVSAPMKGDIYYFQKDFSDFCAFRIQEVVGDTVYLNYNQQETSNASMFVGTKEPRKYLKSELKTLLSKNELFGIKRPD